MTISTFYAESARNGRAVIDGNPIHPQTWIVRARNHAGQESYWHCESTAAEIREVDAAMELARLQSFRNWGGRPRGRKAKPY